MLSDIPEPFKESLQLLNNVLFLLLAVAASEAGYRREYLVDVRARCLYRTVAESTLDESSCFSFLPTALAIIAFNKKKQKYDEAVKKAKDIENDLTLSWLPISYRNSFAFSYISDCIISGKMDTLKEALNDFEMYQRNLLLAASLNRPLS